jgi:hypothetical protein
LKIREEDHRGGLRTVAPGTPLAPLYTELKQAIEKISDQEIIDRFKSGKRKAKSISQAINSLLNERLIAEGWEPQSRIYRDSTFKNKTWTLDFAKSIKNSDGANIGIAVEVVFNHGEAIAWNLIKPTLAAEENNNVPKQVEIGDGVGVYICATRAMHKAGGFDPSVGDFEKVLTYLKPLKQLMPAPLIIIGLEAPESFKIKVEKDIQTNKKYGEVEPFLLKQFPKS